MVKVFIQTFGCSLNQSDSEVMAGILEKKGHEIVDNIKYSDIVIINSCTVKNSAETKMFRAIKYAEEQSKKVILAGCVPVAEKKYLEKELKNYVVIGTKNITDIVKAVDDVKNNKKTRYVTNENKRVLSLKHKRINNSIEILPISEGCLGNCNYCKTKMARGQLQSYPVEIIVGAAKKAVAEKVRFIWITSQDTGAYGKDIGSSLPELLNELMKIEGEFKIRLGMCNPNFAKEYCDKLIEILKNEKMFKFIHLPLQSGSSKVLGDMNRRYDQKDFLETVKKMKKAIPHLGIATDIIVGYPTETDEDFEQTLKVILEIKPDVVNLSRYWKRPGTVAANLKPLPSKLLMERSKKLKSVFEKITAQNKKVYVGKTVICYVVEKGKNNTYLARTNNYLQVVIEGKNLTPGQKIRVKIVESGVYDLKGTVLA